MKSARTSFLPLVFISFLFLGCGGNETPTSDSCTDGVKNQNETDVDCGGICPRCTLDKACRTDNDCESENCDNGTCGNLIEDQCPDDPNKTEPGQCGCGIADEDPDSDQVASCHDNCPNDANPSQTDSDSDSLGDACDGCPNDPDKQAPGPCGCGVVDTDSDSDEVPDCIDNCIDLPNPDQEDGDSDGVGDACDNCPNDPQNKCFCYSLGTQCPSGFDEWCTDAQLDPYSSDQAKAACEACFEADCVLTNNSCAGGAWTIEDTELNPHSMAFGFEDGCSGPRGRIWSTSNTFQGFGYWADMPDSIPMTGARIIEMGIPVFMGIAFSDNSYWTCSGGGQSGERLQRYDQSGEHMAGYSPRIDFRSVFTQKLGDDRLFASEAGSRDVIAQETPGSFSTINVFLNGGLINSNAGFIFDYVRGLYVSHSANTIFRWTESGEMYDTIELQGFGQDFPQEDSGYASLTLAVSSSGHYLTFFDGRLSVWNENGIRLWTTMLDNNDQEWIDDQNLSFSYTGPRDHGSVWIVEYTLEGKIVWHSWDIGL